MLLIIILRWRGLVSPSHKKAIIDGVFVILLFLIRSNKSNCLWKDERKYETRIRYAIVAKNKYDNLSTLLLRSANTFVDYADDKIELNISNFEESLNTSTY